MANATKASSTCTQGIRLLGKHRADQAVKALKEAVNAIPPTERIELARALHFLAIALMKTGRKGVAIRSWAAARRLDRSSPAARFHARFVNDYGMIKRSSSVGDDFAAFCSIQVCSYLEAKPEGRFSSEAEREMVEQVVRQGFAELYARGGLAGMGTQQKLGSFKAARLDFPLAMDLGFGDRPSREVSRVDFVRGRCMEADDRCNCGSGLVFSRCCGKVSTPMERFGPC